MGVQFSDFMMQVRRMKKKVNSIEGLKKMWGADNLDHKVRKCIRIMSYQFMRKHCLRYIFHSKVRNYGTHIKYRQKLIEGIENPVAFNHIKDFWFKTNLCLFSFISNYHPPLFFCCAFSPAGNPPFLMNQYAHNFFNKKFAGIIF